MNCSNDILFANLRDVFPLEPEGRIRLALEESGGNMQKAINSLMKTLSSQIPGVPAENRGESHIVVDDDLFSDLLLIFTNLPKDLIEDSLRTHENDANETISHLLRIAEAKDTSPLNGGEESKSTTAEGVRINTLINSINDYSLVNSSVIEASKDTVMGVLGFGASENAKDALNSAVKFSKKKDGGNVSKKLKKVVPIVEGAVEGSSEFFHTHDPERAIAIGVGSAAGGIIGGAIGTYLAGPAGSAIGGATGAFVGKSLASVSVPTYRRTEEEIRRRSLIESKRKKLKEGLPLTEEEMEFEETFLDFLPTPRRLRHFGEGIGFLNGGPIGSFVAGSTMYGYAKTPGLLLSVYKSMKGENEGKKAKKKRDILEELQNIEMELDSGDNGSDEEEFDFSHSNRHVLNFNEN